jgi:hypothetical protein
MAARMMCAPVRRKNSNHLDLRNVGWVWPTSICAIVYLGTWHRPCGMQIYHDKRELREHWEVDE